VLSVSRGLSASSGWKSGAPRFKVGLHVVFKDVETTPEKNYELWYSASDALESAFPDGFNDTPWSTLFDVSVHGKGAGSPYLRMIFCDKVYRTPNNDLIWEKRPKLPYASFNASGWIPEKDFRAPVALAGLLGFTLTDSGEFVQTNDTHASLVAVIRDNLIRRPEYRDWFPPANLKLVWTKYTF
jgi:hypothetical protein